MIAHVVVFSLASAGGVLGPSLAERVIIGGGNGVYLFFTLSGYLLFLPFLRHQLEGRPVNLARYARNRALRILPLYATVVVVLFLVAPAGAHVDWWHFALFIESFSPDALHRVDFPIWSVVVEVHFYLLLPLIAWVIARLGERSPWRTAAIVAAIGIGSWALRSTRVIDADAPDIFGAWGGRYALPTLMYLFTSGMLLAIARWAGSGAPRAGPTGRSSGRRARGSRPRSRSRSSSAGTSTSGSPSWRSRPSSPSRAACCRCARAC